MGETKDVRRAPVPHACRVAPNTLGCNVFLQCDHGFLDIFEGYISGGYLVIEALWNLADLAIAGALTILGLKVLRGECFSAQLQSA
jgi:hypothetical protein